jgi:hypothetical protein
MVGMETLPGRMLLSPVPEGVVPGVKLLYVF